ARELGHLRHPGRVRGGVRAGTAGPRRISHLLLKRWHARCVRIHLPDWHTEEKCRMTQPASETRRPHVVVINRWRERYAEYGRYLDHEQCNVSYVTTTVGL